MTSHIEEAKASKTLESFIPNPQLNLLDWKTAMTSERAGFAGARERGDDPDLRPRNAKAGIGRQEPAGRLGS